jgi:hypothetical protein
MMSRECGIFEAWAVGQLHEIGGRLFAGASKEDARMDSINNSKGMGCWFWTRDCTTCCMGKVKAGDGSVMPSRTWKN